MLQKDLKKLIYIGILAVLCGSCASQAPLDDTYYWPDKKAQSTQITPNTPTMQIISEQDTTVTIRINR